MTREEAIYWLNDLKRNNHCDETLDMAIAALRGPQPDPETGLMPCGCGGKVKIKSAHDDTQTYVVCEGCNIGTVWYRNKMDVLAAWNRAMGMPDA